MKACDPKYFKLSLATVAMIKMDYNIKNKLSTVSSSYCVYWKDHFKLMMV